MQNENNGVVEEVIDTTDNQAGSPTGQKTVVTEPNNEGAEGGLDKTNPKNEKDLSNQKVPYPRFREALQSRDAQIEELKAQLEKVSTVQKPEVKQPTQSNDRYQELQSNPLFKGIEFPEFNEEYETPQDFYNDFMLKMSQVLPTLFDNHVSIKTDAEKQQIEARNEAFFGALDEVRQEVGDDEIFDGLFEYLMKREPSSPEEIHRISTIYLEDIYKPNQVKKSNGASKVSDNSNFSSKNNSGIKIEELRKNPNLIFGQ